MNKSISAACALLQAWRDRGPDQALFHTNIFTANFFKMCNQIRQNHSAPAISSHEPLTVTMAVLSIGLEPKVEQQPPFPITHQLLGLVHFSSATFLTGLTFSNFCLESLSSGFLRTFFFFSFLFAKLAL